MPSMKFVYPLQIYLDEEVMSKNKMYGGFVDGKCHV